MDDDKNSNICFDCANAYAHKCEYILMGEPRRIKKCPNFVPDYIAKGVEDILDFLNYPKYLFVKLGDKALKKEARKKGCRLDIVTKDSGRKFYYLRIVKGKEN